MTRLPREAWKSTEHLAKLDGQVVQQQETIQQSESLVPAAKDKHLRELVPEYREKWLLGADAARKDFTEAAL